MSKVSLFVRDSSGKKTSNETRSWFLPLFTNLVIDKCHGSNIWVLHIIVPLAKLVLKPFWCKILSSTTFQTSTIYTWTWVNFRFWLAWENMSIPNSQIFNSFGFVKWKILVFFWSNFKVGPEHKMTFNFFSTCSNGLKPRRCS